MVKLLPTPVVNDMGAGKTVEAWDEWTAEQREAHGNGNGHGASLSIEVQRLLPTPTTSDAKGPSPSHGGTTAEAVTRLLPTPTVDDSSNATRDSGEFQSLTRTVRLLPTPDAACASGGHESRGGNRSDEPLLSGAAKLGAVSWGEYEAAIRRHEHITGLPHPPAVDGKGRLSAAFVEWMMMLPPGWVTDVVKTKTAALRMLGNGVVPPAAAHALAQLLERRQEAA